MIHEYHPMAYHPMAHGYYNYNPLFINEQSSAIMNLMESLLTQNYRKARHI